MEANIVIFGKNSIIAKNFINNNICRRINFINISRYSKHAKDINFDIGKFITQKDLSKIVLEIKKKLTHKKTIFILFSWCGGPRNTENLEKTSQINKNIIKNFINISELVVPSRIVFLSSAGALYPEEIKSYKFPETFTPSPKTFYGKQKYLAEKILVKHSQLKNQNLLILRISSAYGFDKRFSDQGVINKWLYSVANNKTLKLYNSIESQINFISFDQISKAIFISLEKELSGIYNIGSENSISLAEVIEEIKKISNKKIFLEKIHKSNRYFNIETKKFKSKTGLRFELNLRENIKTIYESINKVNQ